MEASVKSGKKGASSPKKRTADKTNDDAGPAKKKRASPKSKKAKDDVEDEDAVEGAQEEPMTPVAKGRGRGKATKAGKDEDNAGLPITPPKTPKAKNSKAAKTINKSDSSDDGDALGGPSVKAPVYKKGGAASKRASTGKGGTVPISTSIETASPADRMLIKMKEDGKSWAEIRAAWVRTILAPYLGRDRLASPYLDS